MKFWKRVLGVAMILGMTIGMTGCDGATYGVGVSVAYPGPYGPYGGVYGSPYGWGGTSVYVGGPMW